MQQKIIYIALLIFGILFSSTFYSCGEGEIDKVAYITESFINNSGKDLSIQKWKAGNSTLYNLSKLQTIAIEIELSFGGCSVNGGADSNANSSQCLTSLSDSLKIVFEDKKSLFFKPDDARLINILNFKNYKYSTDGNKQFYHYTFTEKDYLEAK